MIDSVSLYPSLASGQVARGKGKNLHQPAHRTMAGKMSALMMGEHLEERARLLTDPLDPSTC
jgi:hypothetical protein